jgi:hypothetical protein
MTVVPVPFKVPSGTTLERMNGDVQVTCSVDPTPKSSCISST